ncbi:MAG: hypothetical protein M1827_005472 [Pycnora praestabilis]|nr:MAG: hypothetical protein M1827_005472 [Pycnora praestabilis]
MKTSSIIALSSLLLSSLVVAAPFNKRDVVVVTVTDEVIETIDITTTIYVGANDAPSTVQVSATTTSTAAVSSTTTSVAALQTYQQPSPSSSWSTSTTPAYVAPSSSSIPASSSSTSTTPVVVNVPTPSQPVAAYTPPASTTSAAAAASSPASSSGDAATGQCSSGSPCTGDITFYAAGLGACGETSDGSAEDVIALPFGMMGTQSNGNPFCGKTVTIKLGSKSATATVVDKCMGCTGNSIDLSTHVFNQLADESVGRTQAEWYFN